MKILDVPGWRYYVNELKYTELDKTKTGKWMYFFKGSEGKEFVDKCCRETVEQGIVWEAKNSDGLEGVACFYLNIDDTERHKRIIQYFVDHGMIRRTKAGKLFNISFKLDEQTRAGDYGDDFKAELKLADLMDLSTGKWLI